MNSFVYDDNGAMLEKRDANGSAIWSFTRDDRRRVVGMSGSGLANGTGSLQYDMQGARLRHDDSAGTRLFHLEGDHLEAVYDGAGALREKYLRGVVIDEVVNGYLLDAEGKLQNLSFHHDHLNSVVGLSGHSGGLEEMTLFSAFGETLSTSGSTENAMRYTGRRQVDGSQGLYYYRARYYDPEIGRFLSEDPLGFRAGINFYAYVENNPINANDPDGEILNWAIGAGVGAVVGVVGQGVSDYLGGEGLSGWETYTGAAVGGAATGALLGGTLGASAMFAGGAGSAIGNGTQQMLSLLSGSQTKVDVSDFVYSTAFGAVGAKIPGAAKSLGLKVPGITSGNGSWAHVAATQMTKLTNGTTSSIGMSTFGKILGSNLVGDVPTWGAQAVTDQIYQRVEPSIDSTYDNWFGTPSLQTDFNSGYSFASESTNLGSFDQLYNTW